MFLYSEYRNIFHWANLIFYRCDTRDPGKIKDKVFYESSMTHSLAGLSFKKKLLVNTQKGFVGITVFKI